MAWLCIAAAGVMEAAWPSLLGKYQHIAWMPAVISVAFCIPIFYLLGAATRSLPVPTVYLAFVSLGTIGNVVAATLISGRFGDPMRLVPIALVVIGLVWLQTYRTE